VNPIRVGHGYDVHQLVPGRDLIIGGVNIPYHLGAEGHSDADVLLHAIGDALLGAAALGDMGHHFPDSDPKWKDSNSKNMFRAIVNMLKNEGYTIGNIDSTVILQQPRIQEYIPSIRNQIADIAGTDFTSVSIKATTTEKLGFEGRGEGIAAEAVVLIYK
jgi:2-C-methyl-D-erythritol 2,4-cyclodiphosphate synthase